MELNIIKITKLKGGNFKTNTMEVEAKSMNEAILFLATETKADGDCFFIDADTMSPITFDTTMHRSCIDEEGTIASDMFDCTYNKLLVQLRKNEAQPRFVRHSPTYIRVLKSRSGRAGEFFKLWSDLIKQDAELADGTIFNNSELYFENRKVPEVY